LFLHLASGIMTKRCFQAVKRSFLVRFCHLLTLSTSGLWLDQGSGAELFMVFSCICNLLPGCIYGAYSTIVLGYKHLIERAIAGFSFDIGVCVTSTITISSGKELWAQIFLSRFLQSGVSLAWMDGGRRLMVQK